MDTELMRFVGSLSKLVASREVGGEIKIWTNWIYKQNFLLSSELQRMW